MLKKRRKAEHKFCPVCGAQLLAHDAYCTRCGYSFEHRHKKAKNKQIKWKNIIIFLIIALVIYLTIRYFSGEPLIPDFSNWLNFSNQSR